MCGLTHRSLRWGRFPPGRYGTIEHVFEPPAKWLTVDVGETTGWATWEHHELIQTGQTPLWRFVRHVGHPLLGHDAQERFTANELDITLITAIAGWERIIIEDWHLYEDLAMSLVGDKQDTVRGLGALQFIAQALNKPCTLQPASIKHEAELGGSHNLYRTPLHPNRHMNDAIDHGVYYKAYLKGEAMKAARKAVGQAD